MPKCESVLTMKNLFRKYKEKNVSSLIRRQCTNSYCNKCNQATDVWSCCSPEFPCDENEGDCDSHSDCSGNLLCGHDNCGPNYEPFTDCCERVPIGNKSLS